jgi:hypothetical protein
VKYILMMFGDQSSMMELKTTEWIQDMIQFMHQINKDLTASGELVDAVGLVDANQAKTVAIQNGIPVATDGPFAESKESLAGYWIVDVESEARAIEITSRVVAFTEGRMEVRAIGEAPPEV